jgi:hypothetical protein
VCGVDVFCAREAEREGGRAEEGEQNTESIISGSGKAQGTKKSDTFSICACHPCAGAMLIFSVSFQFYRMRRVLHRSCTQDDALDPLLEHIALVAQWIEHQTSNLGVAGSSPARGTSFRRLVFW